MFTLTEKFQVIWENLGTVAGGASAIWSLWVFILLCLLRYLVTFEPLAISYWNFATASSSSKSEGSKESLLLVIIHDRISLILQCTAAYNFLRAIRKSYLLGSKVLWLVQSPSPSPPSETALKCWRLTSVTFIHMISIIWNDCYVDIPGTRFCPPQLHPSPN